MPREFALTEAEANYLATLLGHLSGNRVGYKLYDDLTAAGFEEADELLHGVRIGTLADTLDELDK